MSKKAITLFLILELTLSSFSAYAGIMPLESKRHWKAQLFIANQIKGVGLVDSYQEDGGDASYVYDNCLAAIASMLMGNFGLAIEILNTLTREVEQTEAGVPFEFYYYSDADWKSTEHNVIAYVALRNFGRLNNFQEYVTKAENIRTFLTGSIIWNGVRFNRGAFDSSRVVDVQALGVLLLGNDYASALTWAEENLMLTRPFNLDTVTGFDFNNDRDTVWLEGTIQMALAFYNSGDYEKGAYYFNEACKTMQSDGSLLLATNRGTADGWMLDTYRAITPTSWFIIYYYKFSPLILY